MVIVIDEMEVENVPENLEDFFDKFPSIGEANLELTDREHVSMWRDQVLFIRQRQQATSDFRENPKVRWIGSHAAMTCHIVVMRHSITKVVSLGHFDNFCCWQFGEDSSAHRDGIDIMVEEIAALSCGNVDSIQVSVVGGYTDVRGDAAKNSLSLLDALHQHWAYLNLVHFCVGKYNTQPNENEGHNEAILKGIAIDLQEPDIFPALYNWGQYEDFKTQLKVKAKCKKISESNELKSMTDGSTFKPKSLKNHSRTVKNSGKTRQAEEEAEAETDIVAAQAKNLKRALVNAGGNCYEGQEEGQQTVQELYKVKLKPLRLKLNDPWAPRKARKSSKSEQ